MLNIECITLRESWIRFMCRGGGQQWKCGYRLT